MKYLFFVFTLFVLLPSNAQSDYYLIGEDASVNLNFSDNPPGDAGMLFEAKPIVRYRLKNTIQSQIRLEENSSFASWYLLFAPHIRMYNENSEPVKMPSYIVSLGHQKGWKYKNESNTEDHVLAYAFESGHYSNGQSGCAFSTQFSDGSTDCNNIYNAVNSDPSADLTQLMNRTNGHYQTNYTSLFFNFRRFFIKDDSYNKSYSMTLYYTLYHRNMFFLVNYGGFSDNDIQIYGRHRFGVDFSRSWYGPRDMVFRMSQKFGFIAGSHNHVTNYRSETSLTLYPFPERVNLGFKAAHVFGHDDYNLRFVDNVSQFTLGVVFSPFGLFSMNN